MLLWSLLPAAFAGGGPENVVVVYNADDPDAEAVAAHYEDVRDLPPGHLCGVPGIVPGTQAISFTDYDTLVRPVVDDCVASLPQPDDVDFLVLVRGLPYRVDIDDGYSASLEAMLEVAHATRISDGEEIAGLPQLNSSGYYQASVYNPAFIPGYPRSGDYDVSNPYEGWYESAPGIVRLTEVPHAFRRTTTWKYGGYDFTGQLYVVTRLDGFDYTDATALVDRGVASDGTFPTAELLCMRGSDDARAARDPECEFVTRMLSSAGFDGVWLDTFDGSLSDHTVAAYFTGTADLQGGIAGQTYVPGAITCNLTSYGAVPNNFFCSDDGTTCPGSESQTSIARYVRAGASGASGTVNEPLNNVFPNAGAMLLYTFGYNLGESYFYSQQFLYWQNIVLGDPLASPFAERPVVAVAAADAPDAQTVPQNRPLVVTATHPNGVDRVALYVDGVDVADADGDTVSYTFADAPGTQHTVLAVAWAKNVAVERAGWPVENPLAQPDVQGWTSVDVTVGDPVSVDTGSGDDTGEDVAKKGCGCDSGASGGTLIPWLAMALATRRRR